MSAGMGTHLALAAARAARCHRLAIALLLAPLAACSVDVQDMAGPRVPLPNVQGAVARDVTPAQGLEVDLRTESGVEIATTTTTGTGTYGFADVLPGLWEIRVSGDRPGDFDSVTRPFELDSAGRTLPMLNVHAYGAQAVEPVADASLPVPSQFAPLVFRWTLPARPGAAGRVQVYTSAGEPVWFSSKLESDQVSWDGLGNQGAFQGRATGPGEYTWRLKFALPDSAEGRLAYRRLVLS